jgi:hypothetical protein
LNAHTLDNWRKVKTALEAAGKTDTHYYKRAVAILAGKPDPLEGFLSSPVKES